MNPIEHPGTILLIHSEMVRREITHGSRQPVGRGDRPRPIDRNGPNRLRRALSGGLIALARRIAPDAADAGIPAGAPR
jgi:hypothetical protein